MATSSLTPRWSVHLAPDMAGKLLHHLFPGDGDEHGAVLGVSIVETDRGVRLLGRRLYLAEDGSDYVEGTRGYRMLTAMFVRDRILDCEREGLGYLAIHCHGGTNTVAFSGDDLASHERGYPALLDILGGQPVGALVFARDAVAGDIWLPDSRHVELDHARLLGSPIRELRSAPSAASASDPTFDRQSRLFGDRGQAMLSRQKVGVIGAGGAGSLVIEYLARLGVGHLVVVDPERIEASNLPRIVGSRRRDTWPWLTNPSRQVLLRKLGDRISTTKVKIAERVANQANPKIRFEAIHDDVTRDAVVERLIDCDYLILAADSAQARLVVNAVVHQYLIPGVQVGAKVQLGDDGKILDIFSVVRPMNPGESCLWCNQLISPAHLQDEALTPVQRRQQRYVEDDDVHAPSVITLNALAAAHAVNDYLITTVGLVGADWDRRWSRFHPATPNAVDRVVTEQPRRDPDCRECGRDGRLGAGRAQRLPVRP
ncbi:MAG: ThiF family adenylyltransferase [Pseudonocardiaceae bacterium]